MYVYFGHAMNCGDEEPRGGLDLDALGLFCERSIDLIQLARHACVRHVDIFLQGIASRRPRRIRHLCGGEDAILGRYPVDTDS